MEDKEHQRKIKKHKIGKVIKLFIYSPIWFLVLNVIMNYLSLALRYAKTKKTMHITGDIKGYWNFKFEYLYKETTLVPIFFVFGIAFVISAFMIMREEQKWQVKFGAENLKSDDRWMTEKEISENFEQINLNKIGAAEQGGIMLASKDNTGYLDTENIHTLVIGTTRSGKGQLVILPLIRTISCVKEKQSFITNDMKGDAIESTYSILKENGYKVFVLNLDNANISDEWDLLFEAKKEYVKAIELDKEEPDLSNCMKIIESIASLFTDNPKSDPVWPDSAHALLVAMILYMMEQGYKNKNLDKVTMPSVYHFFVTYGEHDEIKDNVRYNALDEIFHKLPVGNPARAAYASSNFAKGEMRGSIFSVLASNLKIFSTDMGVQKITSGNTLDLSQIVTDDKPCAVFLILPDEDRSRDIIASAFVNQCYDYLVKQAKKYPRKMLPRRVQFILDEFANMPRIPAMDNKTSIGAGHNILFTLVVQSLNQLDDKYGTMSKSIRGTCGNVMYINSIDKDTNEYISALLGSNQYDITSYSGSLHEWINHKSISHETKPLMTATQLGRMSKGKAVIVRQRSYPIKTKFKFFYKYGVPITPIEEIPVHRITRKLSQCFYPIELFQTSIGMEVVPNRGKELFHQAFNAPEEKEEQNNFDFTPTAFNDEPQQPDYDYVDIEYIEEENNKLNEIFEKLNKNTNGKFNEEMEIGNYERAVEIAKTQSKMKKISKEELEIFLSEIEQFY